MCFNSLGGWWKLVKRYLKSQIRLNWIVGLVVCGLAIVGCAGSEAQHDAVNSDESPMAGQDDFSGSALIVDTRNRDVALSVNAIEEHFNYIMYKSNGVSNLLELEGVDEFGLTGVWLTS